jgi:hypothetical protein
MTNQFSTVTNTGFFSRIGRSFVGLLLGPVVLIGAIVLLSWNEGRAVQALSGLGEASKSTVEAGAAAVAAGNEGKLVHVVGPATATSPIADPDLGISFAGQVAVVRTVEMYQWREKKEQKTRDKLGGGQETVTTYTYEKVWSDSAQDSSQFEHADNHANPAMPFTGTRLDAGDAKLGAYALDAGTLALLGAETALTPEAPDGWKINAGTLYKGDPTAPAVGDLRVSYKGLPSGTTVSVLAQQSHGGFAPYVTKNGYRIDLARIGNLPSALMIAERKQTEGAMTWVLRAVGFFLSVTGITMFLGPLSAFAAVIPFLGNIARGAAFFAALVISLPLTLVVVAVSWIAFRPLIGVGLLVVAAGALYGLHRLHRARHPVVAAAPAAPIVST